MLKLVGLRKVRVSKAGVAAFNRTWPCSNLRATRAYWFEFALNGDLVGTNCPEQDDGPEASAMAEDCKGFLFRGDLPAWAYA